MARRIALVFLVLLVLVCSGCKSEPVAQNPEPPKTNPEPPPPPPPPPQAESPLSGRLVNPDVVSRRAIAVMMDNSLTARPQSGLGNASIVYEILAEGGITRLLAVFHENDADIIGPVRSTRHYFVWVAAGHDAVFAHCGASPQGYAELQQLKVPSLDDMKMRDVFWRMQGRSAPHNLYTSTANLRAAMAERKMEKDDVPVPLLEWTDDEPEGTKAHSITIPYQGGASYVASYEYDEASQMYRRFSGGNLHVDATSGLQIECSTVLVFYIDTWLIPQDPELRIDMQMVGSGKARIFSHGVQREIRWSKDSKTSPFVLTELDGTPVKAPRGRVWIQIVPKDMQISFK